MIYKTSELKILFKDFYWFKKAIDEGVYYKIGHGLYSDSDPTICELEILFAQYPGAILTMESAFAYYELSDYVPDKYYVSTGQNAHKILNPKFKQIYTTNAIQNIGKQTIETKYGHINIYDKERMLIELFRNKTKLDYAYFKEVANCYRDLFKQNKLDYNKLINYCSMFKNGSKIKREIQDIIL